MLPKGSLRSLLWVPITVFIVLYALAVTFNWRAIEQDVQSSVQAALNEQGYLWAQVDTYNRGRDVLMTGTAPTELDLRQAESLVISLDQVRLLDNRLKLRRSNERFDPSRAPTELQWFTNGKRFFIEGRLPSQEAIDALLAQARQYYGEDKVAHRLVLDESASELRNSDVFFEALARAEGPRKLSLSNYKLTVGGDITGDEARVELLSSLSQSLGLYVSINDQLNVKKAEPKEQFLAAEDREVDAAVPKEPVTGWHCGRIIDAYLAKNDVQFASGKSIIKVSSYPLLDNIAAVAAQCPDANFEVAGHTDLAGDAKFNQSLSEARAQSVKTYLANKAVDTKRIKAVGYGSDKPVASNDTAEGRALNRRITVTLLESLAEPSAAMPTGVQ